ncbi:NADH dehydrogenase complex I [Diplonema papillatum]|nr:NADH dehydrogenase complex I [Diplonema papillatum]
MRRFACPGLRTAAADKRQKRHRRGRWEPVTAQGEDGDKEEEPINSGGAASGQRQYTEEDVRQALALKEQMRVVGDWDGADAETRDDILLYECKPLYITAGGEKQSNGQMLFRDYMHACLWGLPNRFRGMKGFLQRARLSDLSGMLERIYDTDFKHMTGGEYADEMRKLKSEPLLRPKIPSLLNPQFAAAVLNYLLKQMKKLGTKRLIIYELSGHNGQTALGILDLLQENHPEIYASCEYHMIDVLGVWMTHRDVNIKAHHYEHYFEHHVSIFDWEVLVPDRVFFLCLEVLSYLPFDRVDILPDDVSAEQPPIIWEVGIKEDIDPDERFEVQLPIQYSRIKNKDVHRPLQDELIIAYLRAVDHSGIFTPELIEQSLYRGMYRSTDRFPPEVFFFRGFQANLNIGTALRNAAGMLNNYFWIPSLHVSLCEKLRKYFPRHTLFVLDQSGLGALQKGYNAPSIRQYHFGTWSDIDYYYTHEQSMGPTEFRYQMNYNDFRTLYYNMMRLPPEHPLHLRCLDLPSFFAEYGTEDLRAALAVRNSPIEQPVESFLGARILCAEFGVDEAEVGDRPDTAAAPVLQWRQRVYDKCLRLLRVFGIGNPEGAAWLGSNATLTSPTQTIDTTAVREALGDNPKAHQLDVPIGYKAPGEAAPALDDDASATLVGSVPENGGPSS